MYKGNDYIGSPALLQSEANQEIVPDAKSNGWTFGYSLYKFEFDNDQACTVTINKSNTIYLRAGRGFITTPDDAPITSFIIKEPNITYTWAAAY